jgi:hypothetical protein
MEKINGRRGFLKGFGLAGVVLGGASGGYIAATREIANVASANVATDHSSVHDIEAASGTPDIAHLAPKENATSLVITGDNRPPPPPPPPVTTFTDSSYVMTCATSIQPQTTLSIGGNFINRCPEDQLNRVAMAVGKDDRLWIKVGEQWKRVVVEG